MDNPYWHPYYKPHAINFDEVRDLCFDAFSIIAASHSIAGLPGDEVGGPLHEYFLRTAEARLSDCLLTIAVRMRTFEDILSEEAKSEYEKVVLEHTGDGELGSLGWNDKAERVNLTFREACNKIIHTKDFRPTYDNDSNDREENYAWGMTGIVELAGTFGKREWDVWLTAEEFLSACLYIANVVDPLSDDDDQETESKE